MNCLQVRDCFTAMIQGELSREEVAAVRNHLTDCDACASQLTASQWVEVLPALDEGIEPSADFALRFHRKLQERRMAVSSKKLHWRWPRQLFAAAAFAGVLVIGIFIGRYPVKNQSEFPGSGSSQMTATLPMLQDMPLLSNLDLAEDFETIKDLPSLLQEESAN